MDEEAFQSAWQRLATERGRDVTLMEIMEHALNISLPSSIPGVSREVDLPDSTRADIETAIAAYATVGQHAAANVDINRRLVALKAVLAYLGPEFTGSTRVEEFMRPSFDDLMRPDRG